MCQFNDDVLGRDWVGGPNRETGVKCRLLHLYLIKINIINISLTGMCVINARCWLLHKWLIDWQASSCKLLNCLHFCTSWARSHTLAWGVLRIFALKDKGIQLNPGQVANVFQRDVQYHNCLLPCFHCHQQPKRSFDNIFLSFAKFYLFPTSF